MRMRKEQKSKEDIDSIMPASASPLDWLVSYMNFVAVWYNSFKFGSLTDEQKNSLQKLVNSGVLSNNITGVSTDEYYRCKYLDDYAKGLIDVIPLEEREFYTVRKEVVL